MVAPRKRNRTDTQKPTRHLYSPFRALGLVTSHVPFQIQVRGSKHHTKPDMSVLSCIGNQWALWDVEKLGLRFVGSQTPFPITSLAFSSSHVFAAAGSVIYKYHRGRVIGVLEDPQSSFTIASICLFGDTLVSLSEDGKCLSVWDLGTHSYQSTIIFPSDFIASHVIHPSTYLNKVVVASQQGSLAIYNVQTGSHIHTFSSKDIRGSSNSSSPISAIVQGPAIDVLAIGFRDGYTCIYDIRAGERLVNVSVTSAYSEDDDLAITAIAFRDDNVANTLATATHSGHIAVWSLDDNAKLVQLIRHAHNKPVTSLVFLPRQPVMMSSAGDNSIKQWLFETPTTPARLLKYRSGHETPPSHIRFYGEDGKAILSSGNDSGNAAFRFTSVVKDSRSFELSQGSHVQRKLPPVTAMAFSTARTKDWDDMVTVHSNEVVGRTWSVTGKRKGKFTLGDAKGIDGLAQCVCVTACGNFGLIGFSKTGKINAWNLQSGMLRKVFKIKRSEGTPKLSQSLNITGIETDSLNKMAVSTTLSGDIQFFDFNTTKLIETISVGAAIHKSLLHRKTGLMAIACGDMSVRIVDIETKRVVRQLKGHESRILDITFSPDSRWLVTTSLDSVIRTFDLPTGRLIDAFKPHSLATSIAFSPTSDFLATSHVDSVGVFLWANRAQFLDFSIHGLSTTDEVTVLEMPQIRSEEEQEENEEWPDEINGDAVKTHKEEDVNGAVPNTIDTLAEDLITLTLMPRSKWQTLLKLDVIKERNKPVEPEKPPEQTPFFIPTLPGLETRYDLSRPTSKNLTNSPPQSRLGLSSMEIDSDFVNRLRKESDDGNYENFFKYACGLPPTTLDLEIRSLSEQQTQLLLRALVQRMRAHRDFEGVQAMMNVLLRAQGETLMESPDDDGLLQETLELVSSECDRLHSRVGFCLGAVSFVRGAPIT